MMFRRTFAMLALTTLVGCVGNYEEAAYPEPAQPAPPPERPLVSQPEPGGRAEGGDPATDDVVIGGDNDQSTESDYYAETDPSALTEWRSTLEPYGSWVEDDKYGTLWVPSSQVVGQDFTPYVTAGRWTYDDGYVWASDYEWGWVPFHYGRWIYVPGRGWAWIPGRVYRGAWVTWRVGGPGFGYVGWGPMLPAWYWYGGRPMAFGFGYRTPYYFCETRHMFQPRVAPHVVRGPLASDIGQRTQPYVPANPQVQPGRVAANPGVIPAPRSPLGTRMRRGAEGPEPAHLGLDPVKLPRPAPTDQGLARAVGYATPRTAVPLGARPPISALSQGPRPLGYGNLRPGGPTPIASPPSALHTDPRMQQGPTRMPPLRTEPAYRPPSVSSEVQTAPRSPPLVPRMSEPRTARPPMVEHHTAPPVYHHESPSYRPSSPPVTHQAPSYRPSSPPTVHHEAPRFSQPSTPSFRSSPPAMRAPVQSAPSNSRPPSSRRAR